MSETPIDLNQQYFIVKYKRLGGHTHVHFWGGNLIQLENQNRPHLGHIIMTNEQWEQFRPLIEETMPVEERRLEQNINVRY